MFLPSTSVFHASLIKRLKQDSIVNEWSVLEVSGCWLVGKTVRYHDDDGRHYLAAWVGFRWRELFEWIFCL